MKTKAETVEKLLSLAILSGGAKKPGYIINLLSKEDREIVQVLTAKDFEHRIK